MLMPHVSRVQLEWSFVLLVMFTVCLLLFPRCICVLPTKALIAAKSFEEKQTNHRIAGIECALWKAIVGVMASHQNPGSLIQVLFNNGCMTFLCNSRAPVFSFVSQAKLTTSHAALTMSFFSYPFIQGSLRCGSWHSLGPRTTDTESTTKLPESLSFYTFGAVSAGMYESAGFGTFRRRQQLQLEKARFSLFVLLGSLAF